MLSRALILLFLSAAAFPRGGLCGGREEAAAKGCTLGLLIERFNESEKALAAYALAHPPSGKWGGGDGAYFCKLLNSMAKLGDRAALPFLEEKSFMTNAPDSIRSAAAIAYVKVADIEESVEFMRKAFGINDDKGFWRSRLTPLFLGKIDAAISDRSVSDETMARLLSVLVTHTQTTSYSREASWVDDFLVKHCHGYKTSEQRLSLWERILDADKENELKKKHYLPIREAIEAVPRKQRTNLRGRFPDLPPLPEVVSAGNAGRMKAMIASVVGFAALAACAAAAWLAVWRKRRASEAA